MSACTWSARLRRIRQNTDTLHRRLKRSPFAKYFSAVIWAGGLLSGAIPDPIADQPTENTMTQAVLQNSSRTLAPPSIKPVSTSDPREREALGSDVEVTYSWTDPLPTELRSRLELVSSLWESGHVRADEAVALLRHGELTNEGPVDCTQQRAILDVLAKLVEGGALPANQENLMTAARVLSRRWELENYATWWAATVKAFPQLSPGGGVLPRPQLEKKLSQLAEAHPSIVGAVREQLWQDDVSAALHEAGWMVQVLRPAMVTASDPVEAVDEPTAGMVMQF